MKKGLIVAVLVVWAVLIGGCASSFPHGGLFTELKLPVNATSATVHSPKVGTSKCTSILSLVATGDCSIEAARKNGNISTIHHVDWDARNILGIYGVYKVTVYGD